MFLVDIVLMMHRVINLMERAQKVANQTLKPLFAEVSNIERLASITDQTVQNIYYNYFNNYFDTLNLNLQWGN